MGVLQTQQAEALALTGALAIFTIAYMCCRCRVRFCTYARILIACMIIVRPDVANYITRCAFRAQYKKSFESYQTLSPPSLY